MTRGRSPALAGTLGGATGRRRGQMRHGRAAIGTLGNSEERARGRMMFNRHLSNFGVFAMGGGVCCVLAVYLVGQLAIRRAGGDGWQTVRRCAGIDMPHIPGGAGGWRKNRGPVPETG